MIQVKGVLWFHRNEVLRKPMSSLGKFPVCWIERTGNEELNSQNSPVGKIRVYSNHQQGHSALTSEVLKLQPLFSAALEPHFVGISVALKGFILWKWARTVPVIQTHSVISWCFFEDKMREYSTLQTEKLWKMTKVNFFCCHAISGFLGLLWCYSCLLL